MSARQTSPLPCLSLGLLFSIGLAGAAFAQNLVSNPGFETGDFTDWTVSGDSTLVLGVGNGGVPRSGQYNATFFQSGALDTLTQSLLTSAGQYYLLTFWLQNDPGAAGPQNFQVYWDGQLILDEHDTSATPYMQLSFNNLLATASSTALVFAGQNNPGAYYLDDISVALDPGGGPAVPEASTWVTGVAASAFLAGFHLLRSRSALLWRRR